MGFAESWNRYSALAFGAPAAGASTTSTVGANTTFEQKMIMLRSLQEALADARQSGDTRALKIYQEQMDAYTASEAARVRVINTLAQNQGRLDAAKLQAVQRDIANIRDNQTRLLAADAQRGQRMMQQLVYNAAAADPRLASSQNPDPFIDFVLSVASRSLNPDDPASWYALDALRSQYGAGRVNAKLGNLTGRIEAAHGAREAQVRGLQEISIPPTATGRDVEGLLSAAGLTAMERPTFDAARGAAGAVTGEEELKSDIDRLQRDLDLTGTEAATKPDRYGGLSESEVQDMLSDPRFRSYAEDRGFRLSSPRADGTYIVTPQDINALRAAAREQATGRSPLFRGANRPREQMDLRVVRREGPSPDVPLVTLASFSEDKAHITSMYLTYPDGHVDLVDMTTGKATPIASAGGEWTATPSEVSAFLQARKDNGSSILTDPDTERPLTLADFEDRRKASAGAGIHLDSFDSSETSEFPEEAASRFETERGLRMPTRLGEDPERVARMLDPDGTTVVTYEKGDDGMWRETAREENAYRGILRRADEAFPRDNVRARKPLLDRYETPPRPVVDEIFMGEVAGEKAGRIAGAGAGPPAAPNIPDTVYPAGVAITDPTVVEPAMTRREDQRDAARRAMEAAARALPPAPAAPAPPAAPEKERPRVLDALRAARAARARGRAQAPPSPPPAAPAAGSAKPTTARAPSPAVEMALATQMRPPQSAPGAERPGERKAPILAAEPVEMPPAQPPADAARRLARLLAMPPAGMQARGDAPAPPTPPEAEAFQPRPPRQFWDPYDPSLPAALPREAPPAPPRLGLAAAEKQAALEYPLGAPPPVYSTPVKAAAIRKLLARAGAK